MKSNAEVKNSATGFAIGVPRGRLTDGKHALVPCTMAMAVHAALAVKLVCAIHFSLYFLRWPLSGTTPVILAHPATAQPALG